MLRFALLFAGIFLTPVAALACDMKTESRPFHLSAFIENGLNCLDSPPGAFRFDAELEDRFVRAINEARSDNDLPALKPRDAMKPAARFHSLDMGLNTFFSHESPAERTHVDRIGAFDRTLLARGSAENIAQFGPAICLDQDKQEVSCASAPGFKGPSTDLVLSDLHQKLMASEGHRRNILDPNKTHITVGVARTESGFYVTQVFAEVAGELITPAPYSVESGAVLELIAEVPDWTIANLAFSQGDNRIDFDGERVPKNLYGILALSVRAEQHDEIKSGNVTQMIESWIYPSGPLIEIIAPKES